MRQIFILLGIMLMLGLGFEVHAAAQNTASYATGQVCWTWQKGTPPLDLQADHLNVRCGTAPGVRDIPVKTIAVTLPAPNPPEYCINIRDVIPQPATFPVNRYCAAKSALGAGESTNESVELFFVVTGPELAVPTNPRLKP
jgi:hypothetical protein